MKTSLGTTLSIPAVIHPALTSNLLSVHDVTSTNRSVIVSLSKAYIIRNTKLNPPHLVRTGSWTGNQYKMDTLQPRLAGIRAVPYRKPDGKSRPTPHRASPVGYRRSRRLRSSPHPETRPIPTPALTTPSRSHPKGDPNPPPPISQKDALFHAWQLVLHHIQLPTLQAITRENLPTLPSQLPGTPPTLSCPSYNTGKAKPSPHRRSDHK